MLCGELDAGEMFLRRDHQSSWSGIGQEGNTGVVNRKGLHFSAGDRVKAKAQVFKKGCCKLDLTVYLRILRENSGKWNRKEANAQ